MGAPPIGQAMAFMLVFVASLIVGIYTLMYLSRCVLVVVQETGQGQDEIIWPNEPYVDWLGHAVQFLELVGIWLAPAVLAARLLRYDWLQDEGALRVLILAVPGLWLFFPIGLLSSLSAQSRWVPFRWFIFRCFLRAAPAALAFYFLTALVLSAAVVPWYYALFGDQGMLLPLAAPVSAAVVLIYARLLGRLAWIIQRLSSPRPAAAKTRPEEKPQPRRQKKRKPNRNAQDPWAIPEDQKRADETSKRFPWATERKSTGQAPRAEEIEGYGLAADQPAAPQKPPEKPPRSRFAKSPDKYVPYDMKATAEAGAPQPRQLQDDPFFEGQVQQHIAERTRTLPPPPPHPFFSGVYTFPWYSASLPRWIILSLALLVEGGMVKLMIGLGSALFHW